MEGILLAGIIVPYFVSVVAGLTTDHAFYDFFKEIKTKEKKKINHDLQRAVKRSFLSALHDIILECQGKVRQTASHKYPLLGILEYPPEYQEEVRWLDGKFKELAKELSQIGHSDNIKPIFDSFDEIELLLRPTGGAVEEKFQAFEEKLITAALEDDAAPESYKEKVKTDLFQRMCDKFAAEIKYTPEVYNIFTATILPQINQTLLANQQKLQNIESLLESFSAQISDIQKNVEKGNLLQQQCLTQVSDIQKSVKNIENRLQQQYVKKIYMTSPIDFESLSLPELFEVIEKLHQIAKIKMIGTEIGSIKLIFETTEEGAKKFDLLFRTGQLGKILGMPIEDINISDSLFQTTEASVSTSLSEIIGSVTEKLVEKLNALLENPFAEWSLEFAKYMKGESEKTDTPRSLIRTHGYRQDNNIIVLEDSEDNPDELKNDIRLIKSGKSYYLQVLIQNEQGNWIEHGEKIKAESNIPITIKDPGCDSFILLMDQDDDALDESLGIIGKALNNGEEKKVFSTTIIILVEVEIGGIR